MSCSSLAMLSGHIYQDYIVIPLYSTCVYNFDLQQTMDAAIAKQ